MRYLLLTLLLLPLVAGAAEKEIYRTVDEDGNVIYTDQPPAPDAEPVELDPVPTVPAYQGETAGQGQGAGEQQGSDEPEVAYGGVEIVYPTTDEAIRHNGGRVPFRVQLRPEDVALAESHRIEILVDGSVRGSGTGLTVTVGPVDRGPHSVTARVVDAGGNPLATSPTVSFFLLRHSIQ